MAIWRIRLMSWLSKKVVDPLILILRRGAEPKQLAFSAALGITLGLFPICGVTVFLCGMAIALLRSLCHSPTVMLANFIATPLELSLVVPFLRFGEVISGGTHFPLTSDAFKKVLTGQASREVLTQHCSCGWLIAAPFILAILYVAFLPCFKLLVHKFSALPSSPKKQVHSQAEDKLKLSESGLKKELREMLPIIVFRESFSIRDTQCSVCLADYQAEDRLQQIPVCGHTFHMDCIDHWLATHTTCPLCRLSLLPAAKSDNGPSHNVQEIQAVVMQNEVISEGSNVEDRRSRSPQSTGRTRVFEQGSCRVRNEEFFCDVWRADEHIEQSEEGSVVPDIEAHGSVERVSTGTLP
ncbi:hypothetical protein IFM89_039646 [Coptis chinensis]|uniref:RING-type E3 ubiquitin transferase n=1 Tax=Coptis chinensis TaxID=261450 RepID=A0A835GTQ1_9MAGN|nr:hypothetical protein IFM89_039646 [Coptis chinensis]